MTTNECQKKGRVLIIDDQPENIHVLANIIQEQYDVQAATNGAKALEIAFGKNPPDMILLDIVMPEMNGYEVCRRLKADEQTRDIPVIFVTVRNSTEDEEYGFNLGAVDYISKPFQPTVVRVRVRNHMNLKIKAEMLEKLSLRDGLTNIPNRRSFDKELQREWSHAMRGGHPLPVLMIDIDHFKQYNDNYGHGAGDECLKRVAETMNRKPRRPLDFIARYGGEEFVALLPDTDATGALQVAEQLRAAVAEANIPHAHSDTAPMVTISIGVATHSQKTPKTSMEELLTAADLALYQAKEKGRNQVRAESPQEEDAVS